MIVLDASAAAELVLHTPMAARIAARVGVDELHAPHVIELEVCSALRTLERTRALGRAEVEQAMADLRAVEIVRHPHELLLERIWALRGNLTPYDAAYVALAEALRAPMLTCDRKLARVPGHQATIEVLA
jgi:predicted nucleic acid-binding protein